jgi:hypothetical protein
MDLLDAVLELLTQPQVSFDAGFRQEVERIDDIIVRADAIDPPQALDEPHRVPVKVVIDDLITVLKV